MKNPNHLLSVFLIYQHRHLPNRVYFTSNINLISLFTNSDSNQQNIQVRSETNSNLSSSQHNSPLTHRNSPINHKLKTSSNSVLATSGATTKRPINDTKKPRSKTTNNQHAMLISNGSTPKPSISIPSSPMSANNKKTVKSVTDAVISYLHYKGGGGVEHTTGRYNNNAWICTN